MENQALEGRSLSDKMYPTRKVFLEWGRSTPPPPAMLARQCVRGRTYQAPSGGSQLNRGASKHSLAPQAPPALLASLTLGVRDLSLEHEEEEKLKGESGREGSLSQWLPARGAPR